MKIVVMTTKIIISLIVTVLVFVIFSAIHLSMIRSADLKSQRRRMNRLENSYEDYEEKGYLSYSDENLDNTPYNEVSFLASHNSYKKKGSLIGKLFVGLGDSFSEAKALNYSYHTLTDQLQNGIFSFELDLRLRRKNFEITHVPLVDNSSTAVNFELALQEFKYFLDNEPKSFPILIMLEIKDDYMMLDPFLKDINEQELLLLEQKIEEVLKDYLYTPKDMLKDYDSLMERINNEGWPTIGELKGKVMFLIHAGKYANKYLEIESKENTMFTATYHDNKNDNSPFIIHNNLDVANINNLVDNNYMVRTRIGDTISYTNDDVSNAYLSRAQILTSDHTIARSDLKEFLYLSEDKTIRRNNG